MDRGLSHKALRRFAHDSANEVLLHWLGREHCATQVLLRTRQPCTPAPSEWKKFCRGNVVGIGFGAKESAGKMTGDLAVRIYVKRKRPRSMLTDAECAPTNVNGIVTDVIVAGTPKFHTRPIKLGAGISHAQGLGGSLGCIVTKSTDDAWYMLSACHVLALSGSASFGESIVEPAHEDENGVTNPTASPIAALADFEPLKSDGTPNAFDAAIARLSQNSDVTNAVPLIGRPEPRVMEPVLYQSVRKHGAGTLHTLGIVTDPMAGVSFTMDGDSYRFADVIQVTGCPDRFSVSGDSGALVLDALSNRPIGIVIGGAGTRSYVSPIRRVLERFGAQMLQ
jgi:hypothetical protein